MTTKDRRTDDSARAAGETHPGGAAVAAAAKMRADRCQGAGAVLWRLALISESGRSLGQTVRARHR